MRLLEKGNGLTGIATSLLETLRQLNEIDDVNEYFLFSRRPICCNINFSDNWHSIVKDFPQGMIWYNTVLIWLLKKFKIELFWNNNHILPITKPRNIKYILTVNDLAIFKIKGIGEYSNIIKQHIFVKMSCNKADKIIAISEATKRDLHNIFGINNKKIVVNYLGGGGDTNSVISDKTQENVLKKFSISKPFFLYLGTLEPRKNLATLVKAYNLYRKNKSGNELLIIAGGKGWRFEDTQQLIDESPYKDNIKQLGYISNVDKLCLLQNCVGFIFPSLYEGFGIPVVEAMQQGCPVITSRNSSLTEVGGKYAYYLRTETDEKMLFKLLCKVHNLNKLQRFELAMNENKWISRFQWRNTAERFLAIVEDM